MVVTPRLNRRAPAPKAAGAESNERWRGRLPNLKAHLRLERHSSLLSNEFAFLAAAGRVAGVCGVLRLRSLLRLRAPVSSRPGEPSAL